MVDAGERETLIVFLDYLRECVLAKAEGLDEEALRRSTVPSGHAGHADIIREQIDGQLRR